VYTKLSTSHAAAPRSAHIVEKINGLLQRAIKRLEKMNDMWEGFASWKAIQEVVRLMQFYLIIHSLRIGCFTFRE
jgi:hypothetical protein